MRGASGASAFSTGEAMQKQNRPVVVGVFADQARARQAVDELRRANFREEQLGVVGRRAEEQAYSADRSTGSHVAEGAGIGVAAGAGVGALWALGIIAGVLPGIGPAVAGGILGSLLASAAGGAVVAGAAGALIGLGIPEEEARYYEGELKAGRTLVAVKADGRADEAWSILSRNGAYDITTKPAHAGAGV